MPATERFLKLAILVCDHPLGAVVDNYGDYEQMFVNLFTAAGESYSSTHKPIRIVTTAFDVTQEIYPEDPTQF